MTGLVRFLLIVLIIYFVAILFKRYILPFILRLFIKRMSERANKYFQQENFRQNKKKGDITIDFNQKSKKVIDKDTGEYVPFEEIDDK